MIQSTSVGARAARGLPERRDHSTVAFETAGESRPPEDEVSVGAQPAKITVSRYYVGSGRLVSASGSPIWIGCPARPQYPRCELPPSHLHIMHPDPQHLKYFARKNQCRRGKKVRKAALNKRNPWPGLTRLNATTLARQRSRTMGHHMFLFAYCSRTNISSSSSDCHAPGRTITAGPVHHVVQGCLRPFRAGMFNSSRRLRSNLLSHEDGRLAAAQAAKLPESEALLGTSRDWGKRAIRRCRCWLAAASNQIVP